MVSTGCQKVRQGDTAGIKLLLEAVDRHPETLKNFNLCFCLGTGFARQDSHDAALTWYKRALSLAPSNRDAVAGAARSAELLGRTSEALGYYKRLHAIDPGNAAANAYLNKHDSGSPEPTPQPTEEPGELLPIKRKNQ
jgi:tetratricopeptide (TPR) repeat protein